MKVLANDGISQNAVDILNNKGFEVYLDKIDQFRRLHKSK